MKFVDDDDDDDDDDRGRYQSKARMRLLISDYSNWHPVSYRFAVVAAFFKFWTLRFWAPLWGLRDNVRCSSWAYWKARSGLPMFLQANIGSKSATSSLQWEPVDPKFQVEVVAPTNHSSSQKTRLNDLLYGIKIWTGLSSVLSQSTRLTDRRTDSFLLTRPPCIQCSAPKY